MNPLHHLRLRHILLVSLLPGLLACTKKPADVAIRPELELNPPVATALAVQRLDKPTDAGNVLFTAQIPKAELRENVLAVQLSTGKVVLRDDGQGGDEKADDRTFSAIVQQDTMTFTDEIRKSMIPQEGNENRTFVRFVNRSAQIVRPTRFDLESFETGKRIAFELPPVKLVTDPNLRSRSLMITNLGVVEDPNRTINPCTGVGNAAGAWTFGTLMKGLANTTDNAVAVDFIRKWLESWKADPTVNGEEVPARTGIQAIIDNWQTLSGGVGVPLKLERCPFRLLAIVNRLDLRGNSGYGFSNSGEGRFVFGAIGPGCSVPQFTVIFEFGIPKRSCPDVVAFAKQWHDLRLQTPGTPAYNNALQAITDQFATANVAPGKPNGSALNQLRSDELALGPSPWELREFMINGATHQLQLSTVKQEPAKKHNRILNPAPVPADIQRLVNFINTHEADVVANRYEVPLVASDGGAFLGGKAHTINASSYHWNGATAAGAEFITNDEARHVFSLGTCSGCHGGEGKTNAFTHVRPRSAGSEASLSGFLTGLGSDDNSSDGTDTDVNGLFFVSDPANRPVGTPKLRGFNDLKRRADDLEVLIDRVCRPTRGPIFELAHVLQFRPVRMTH